MGKYEPVLNKELIVSLVSAVIACLVAFGLPFSNDQKVAVLTLVGVVCTMFFGGGVVVRSLVTPTAKLDEQTGNPVR